jgi:hypothetical protein
MPMLASNKQNVITQQTEISEIIRDHDTLQVRTEIDPKTVEAYARSMKAGSIFPPVTVYQVDGRLFLVDGFHRVEAIEAASEAQGKHSPAIMAEITEGDMGSAIAAAAVANTTNGKQMKRKEYRTSFRMLGNSGKLAGMNSRSIAALMNHVVTNVTIWNWADKDFPGLLEKKPKKGEKPDINQERYTDAMSSQQVEQRAAISGMLQAQRLLSEGRVTDMDALHDIAGTAKEILKKAMELGGDPDFDVFA